MSQSRPTSPATSRAPSLYEQPMSSDGPLSGYTGGKPSTMAPKGPVKQLATIGSYIPKHQPSRSIPSITVQTRSPLGQRSITAGEVPTAIPSVPSENRLQAPSLPPTTISKDDLALSRTSSSEGESNTVPLLPPPSATPDQTAELTSGLRVEKGKAPMSAKKASMSRPEPLKNVDSSSVPPGQPSTGSSILSPRIASNPFDDDSESSRSSSASSVYSLYGSPRSKKSPPQQASYTPLGLQTPSTSSKSNQSASSQYDTAGIELDLIRDASDPSPQPSNTPFGSPKRPAHHRQQSVTRSSVSITNPGAGTYSSLPQAAEFDSVPLDQGSSTLRPATKAAARLTSDQLGDLYESYWRDPTDQSPQTRANKSAAPPPLRPVRLPGPLTSNAYSSAPGSGKAPPPRPPRPVREEDEWDPEIRGRDVEERLGARERAGERSSSRTRYGVAV